MCGDLVKNEHFHQSMTMQSLAFLFLLSIPAILSLTCSVKFCTYNGANCSGSRSCTDSITASDGECFPAKRDDIIYSCTAKSAIVYAGGSHCTGTGVTLPGNTCVDGMSELVFSSSRAIPLT
eukprot:TRINITY_DN3973_c0_g1_i1.p1 TRINITY_DN3973_c0_g1~~TRINITY_DN3973_c0_g1_i1.p1  ORF type:complete len:122 (-),score=4.00 TRINITY_DN3973_c0_g1_i1:133-498(-)